MVYEEFGLRTVTFARRFLISSITGLKIRNLEVKLGFVHLVLFLGMH